MKLNCVKLLEELSEQKDLHSISSLQVELLKALAYVDIAIGLSAIVHIMDRVEKKDSS